MDVWSRLCGSRTIVSRFWKRTATQTSENLTRSPAKAGFGTVDFMTSASHQWSDPILISSESELNMSCRGRAVIGAPR